MPSYKGCIELSKLTQNQIWMLAVDGKRFQSENGPDGFERREPTSVNRIITVMNKMLSCDDPITVSDLKAYHKQLMNGIIDKSRLGVFRYGHSVGYEIISNQITLDGFLEFKRAAKSSPLGRLIYVESVMHKLTREIRPYTDLRDERQNEANYGLCVAQTASAEMSHIMRCLAGDVGLFYIPSGSDHMDLEVAAILDSYYTKIAQCGDNDDEKLALIATMIKELTRKHAFFDGNNRLFVNCMLLKMLCQNGFGPAILFDPNVFEFLSIAELVATIRQAIVETRQFIDSPYALILAS